jgi:hypothetical protein
VRRFAEGDIVEEGLGVFNPDNASYARRAPKNRTIDDMSFGEAFALKRKELGEGKTFTWRGEKYTTSTKKPKTKLAEDELSKVAPSTPRAKPVETKAAPKAAVKTVTKPLSSKQEESFGRKLGEGALGIAESGMRAAGVPLHYRAFLTTLAGSKRPITEENLTKEELAKLKKRTEEASARGESSIGYGKNKENINPVLNEDPQWGREKDIELTLGRAGFKKGKDKTVLKDEYEFYNPERKAEVERLEKLKKEKGQSAVVKDVVEKTIKDAKDKGLKTAFNKLPSRVGNAFIGRDGRPVEIAMRKGGAVKDKVRGYGIAQKGRGRGRFVR